MSNTSMRFISAAVLLFVVVLSFMIGEWASLGIIVLLGALLVHEIEVNFFKHGRNVMYWASQVIFLVGFVAFFWYFTPWLKHGFWAASLVLNFSLLYYLFFTGMENNFFLKLTKIPLLGLIYTLLNFVGLGLLIKLDHWVALLTLVMIVAYGMDTGAWFFGRKFGKNPLWPSVSPKKTREGLYGGMLTAGVFGTLFFSLKFHSFSLLLPFIFALLGLISQLGDLIQSKLKRQANIKDSSALIPGHGGVFDRVDSLIFLAPFFLVWVHLWWR